MIENDGRFESRLNKEKLEVVIKYCKQNKTTFSKKIRELMDSVYDEAIKDKKDRDQIIEDSKAIRQNFAEIRKLQAELEEMRK